MEMDTNFTLIDQMIPEILQITFEIYAKNVKVFITQTVITLLDPFLT